MTKLDSWKMGGAALLLCAATAIAASAQTFTTLYTFTGGRDGGSPYGLLIASGKLYGTAEFGGNQVGKCGIGCGTVWALSPQRRLLDVPFELVEGANPQGGLITDGAGYAYGTAYRGGDKDAGTIFAVNQTGIIPLHSFGYQGDGGGPIGNLARDTSGNLYGATIGGGAYGSGTVFEVDGFGRQETILWSFTGKSDGGYPDAGLIIDDNNQVYGTTELGGDQNCLPPNGCGTVFIANETGLGVLHTFTGSPDGAQPTAGLTFGRDGRVYGTTGFGGTDNLGTVFRIEDNGRDRVLYSFTGLSDGAEPFTSLIFDSSGSLYGGTAQGGAFGYGTIFKLSPSGIFTVLYTFTGGADGAIPTSLTLDSAGNLYGTALKGGDPLCLCGTVFKITRQ